MEKLLAMILTAYDPRKNPAAGLLLCQASQAWRSVVQLFTSEGSRPEPTNAYYTTNQPERTADPQSGDMIQVVMPSGEQVFVRPVISL